MYFGSSGFSAEIFDLDRLNLKKILDNVCGLAYTNCESYVRLTVHKGVRNNDIR